VYIGMITVDNSQQFVTLFSMRQYTTYMFSPLYTIAHPSVCLSARRVDPRKTVEF